MIPQSDYTEQTGRYTREGKPGAWRVVGYIREPSLIMRNIDTGETETFGVNGLANVAFEPVQETRDSAREEMKLPEGKTCGDCLHCIRCVGMFGVKQENTSCDFHPSKFRLVHRRKVAA